MYNKETGRTITAAEHLIRSRAARAQFVGLKRRINHDDDASDRFEMDHFNAQHSLMSQSYVIMTDGSPKQTQSLEGSEVDLYAMTQGKASLDDVDRTVSKLKEQTQQETILGAIMFSCNGRGPSANSMLTESMGDNRRFAKDFPNVPCVGFYAGGEIGPKALAGNETCVFQKGNAAIQGFTAVFVLFIVPKIDHNNKNDKKNMLLFVDDRKENVMSFVQRRLASSMQ